jgi:hypothetical protein
MKRCADSEFKVSAFKAMLDKADDPPSSALPSSSGRMSSFLFDLLRPFARATSAPIFALDPDHQAD